MKGKSGQFKPGVLINGCLRKSTSIEKWAAGKLIKIEQDFELKPGSLCVSSVEKIGRHYFVHYENKYQ